MSAASHLASILTCQCYVRGFERAHRMRSTFCDASSGRSGGVTLSNFLRQVLATICCQPVPGLYQVKSLSCMSLWHSTRISSLRSVRCARRVHVRGLRTEQSMPTRSQDGQHAEVGSFTNHRCRQTHYERVYHNKYVFAAFMLLYVWLRGQQGCADHVSALALFPGARPNSKSTLAAAFVGHSG